MLETYPSFSMPVYPTRRSASVPQRIYDATRTAAATAELVDDGNGVGNAVIGIPFPIPDNGLEVIWNHLLRYRGESVACVIGQARSPVAAPIPWSSRAWRSSCATRCRA